MKKFLLIPLFSFLIFSCSVDPVETEIAENGLLEINAVSGNEDDGCAGPDSTLTITYSEAAAIESWDEVRKLYLSLLAEGVYRGGEFDPTIWDLIHKFNDGKEGGLGEYTTWYTINTQDCQDTVMLTVIVVADQQSPTCDNFSAGADNSMTITQSEAEAIESWDEVRKLYLSLLDEGVAHDGEFDPSIWDLIREYWNRGPGDYTTGYTITNGECTDSVLLTVTVVPDAQSDPTCDGVTTGPDNSMTITQSEAEAIESWNEVRKLYLSLLADNVSRDGSFDPSIWDIINKFNDPETGGSGEYSTTYTVTQGRCSDSVTLTVIVVNDPS